MARFWCLLVLAWLVHLPQGLGQTKPSGEEEVTVIEVIYARDFRILQAGRDSIIQKLIGAVELQQDSIIMYCDSAILINETYVYAYGNVTIQQGDSLSGFADTLEYDGSTRQAFLTGAPGNVVLVNGRQQLFTDRLDYDLNTKIATYTTGATLAFDSIQLSSRAGSYVVDEQMAYFSDSVTVTEPRFELRSDTLTFNVETRVVGFVGPTLILTDSSRIYCESGYYDTEQGLAEFAQNAQFLQKDQKAVADRILYNDNLKVYTLEGNASVEDSTRQATAELIRYNELTDGLYLQGNARFRSAGENVEAEEITYNGQTGAYTTSGRAVISTPPQILEADSVLFNDLTGLGNARGRVVWRDTAAQLAINCAVADYQRETDYLKARGGEYGRPELITVLEADSLFLTADTLNAIRPDTSGRDSSRFFLAYRQVRIFKSNLQAICDSLSYGSTDSLFQFYYDPVIWSDTTQFTADTIFLQMANGQIDRIFLRGNALIVTMTDSTFFNQIRGKNVTAYFREGALFRVQVEGNAETIYYAKDEEGAYVGVNKTACSEMVISFNNNEIERIKFLTQPNSALLPMQKTDHNAMRLEGFRWIQTGRPAGRADLFVQNTTSMPNRG